MRLSFNFFPCRMRRALSAFLLVLSLVLLFLLAQAGAMAHEFSHFDEDEDEAAEVCALCLAAAALDAAVSLPDALDLLLPPLLAAEFLLVFLSCFSFPCRAYWGRAPPARVRFP
jgi:hypothetical protein